MTDTIANDVYSIDTRAGPALAWARSLPSMDGPSAGHLQPNAYARIVFGVAVDLHPESIRSSVVYGDWGRFAGAFPGSTSTRPTPSSAGTSPKSVLASPASQQHTCSTPHPPHNGQPAVNAPRHGDRRTP